MASIVTFVKSSYLDKNKEARVIIEYTHLYERWRLNTGIKVNPELITCTYDDDTELWKLTALKSLKPAERKKVADANEILRDLNLKINQTVLTLKSRSLPLTASSVEQEFNKDPSKRITRNSKSVLDWYQEFISAKEKEIGEGINSYRSTFQHFKSFIAGKGVIGDFAQTDH